MNVKTDVATGSFIDNSKESANKVAEKLDADILLINGEIQRGLDKKLLDIVKPRNRHKNVILILVTPGGDPDVAYRISRYLQDYYDRFIAYVTGYCKSAGTLCILGATEIVMCDEGELGPLDIQVYKKDEIGELSSGLIAVEALRELQDKAFEMFEDYFLTIKRNSAGSITFKTATETAIKITVGLIEPLYSQIDPIQVGEIARSMKIATAYGKRLMVRSGNFKKRTLTLLSDSYPSHDFVIDKPEVEELFINVRSPSVEEEELRISLGDYSDYSFDGISRETTITFISDELGGDSNENVTESDSSSGIQKAD